MCASTSASVTVNYYATATTASTSVTPLNYCGILTTGSLGGNTPIVGTGLWTQTSGTGTTTFSAPSSGSSTATASVTGTYIYKWTITNGTCSSSANVTVNYYATPTTAAVTTTPLNYCGVLTSGSLGGNAATVGTGLWSQTSGPGTTTFSNASSGSSAATATTSGTYVYTWTITNGTCSSAASVTVNYYVKPSLYSVTASATSYCSNTAGVTIGLSNSQSGINYQLYNGASIVGSPVAGTGSAISFGTQTSGTYTVIATNTASGCTQTMNGSQTVSVIAAPTANAGTAITICASSGQGTAIATISGTAINYASVKWTSPTAGIFGNSTALSTTYTPSAADKTAGSVTLTLTAFGNSPCANATSTVLVTITPAITGNIGIQAVPICSASGYQLVASGTPTGGNGSFTYTWQYDGNCGVGNGWPFNAGAGSPFVVPSSIAGECFIAFISSGGCSVNSSDHGRLNKLAGGASNAISISGTTTICNGSNTVLSASSAVSYTYSWTSNPVGFTSNIASPTVSPIVTTIYTVIGTATSGPSCTKTSPITVNVVNPGTWLGVTSTDWNTPSNWCGGIPTAATNVIIPIVSSGNYPLISNANAVAASVNTNTGASLTMSGLYNLTLSTGASFTNNGAFTGTANTGAVIFAGSGTVAGTVNFNNVTINGAVDFGGTATVPVSTVIGSLILNSGSSLSGATTHQIVYGSTSSLIYNLGTNLTVGNEWARSVSPNVPGLGVPFNVTIQNNSSIVISDIVSGSWTSNRSISGTLTIASGSSLSSSSLHDLYVAGNWINNGLYNPNGKTVTLDGTAIQIISGTNTFYNLTLSNSIDFSTSSNTIQNTFSNSSGLMNGNISTFIFTGSAGSIIGSNSKNFYNLQINSGANITHTSGGGNVHIDNSYTNNGSYTEGPTYTTYFDKNSGTTSLSGSGTTTFGNVTIGQSGIIGAGTTLNSNNHSFTVNGTAFTFNHSSSTFNGGSSTVTFNGISDLIGTGMSVTGTTAAFYGVTVLNTTTLGIDITVNGPLSIMNAANKLAINGNTLSLNSTVTGSGTITGSSTSNIIVGTSGSVGTLNFDQTTANITNVLKDFTVKVGAIAAIGNALNIVAGTLPGTVTANGTINAGNNLTLRSDISGTSRVAASLGSINGNVTVERYIATGPSGGLNHGKSWQLLAVPTQGQSIKASWMEGATTTNVSPTPPSPPLPSGNPNPGYGTMITSDLTNALALGFDAYTSPGPSIKTYVSNLGTYVGPSSTANAIYDQRGYFVFVRGDRSVYTFNGTATPTVLRTQGTLFTRGNPPPQSGVSGNSFTSVGNPYASAIDLRQLTLGSGGANFGQEINSTVAVWDPTLTTGSAYGLGAFQYLYFPNPNNKINYVNQYTSAAYGPAGTIHNDLQSGQAFIIQDEINTGGGTMSFTEADKSANNNYLLTSPARVGSNTTELRVNLYGMNTGNPVLADGTLLQYGSNYSSALDGMDARKFANLAENLSVSSTGKLLTIERTQMPTEQDTVFLNLTGEQLQPYQFELLTTNMDGQGVQAYFEDTYLKTKTALDMNGRTTVDMTVMNVPGSYAANRFRIVFAEVNVGPLPVTFTNVKATPYSNTVNVEWQVDNELNIKNYTIEKSVDGIHFNTLGVTDATGNGGRSASYVVVDNNPVEGYNYYRIRSNDQDGKTNLTQVVKAFIGSLKHDIVVNPNPITNGNITLQFLNMPAGKYAVRLLNKLGQVIMKKQITRMDGNNTETLKWNFNLAHGMYQLEITKPDGSVKTINVIY